MKNSTSVAGTALAMPLSMNTASRRLNAVWRNGSQLLAGLPELSPLRREISGGVAVWAHVGGFVVGALLARWFENPDLVRRKRAVSDAKVVWR
jgi:membrane associated rhomboid family serine protease